MDIEAGKPLRNTSYTNAFRTVLPGLLMGFMFMAVSFASKSAADSHQRTIERSLTRGNETSENLRQEISLDAGVIDRSPVKANLINVTTGGLRRLINPFEAAPLERVTIEIDVPQSNKSDQSSSRVPWQLLEVLSRRASPLQLELTLQVAPANLQTAMLWFDAIRENSAPGQIVDVSQIAVSLDKNVPADKLILNILRTKKMSIRKVSEP